jgi:uncharacterized protein YqeY
MSLFDEIKALRIEAIKSKDALKRDVLGVVIGDASRQDKNPEDKVVAGTIRKAIENNELTLKAIASDESKRETAEQLRAENDILRPLLPATPAQLSEDEIRNLVQENGLSTPGAAHAWFAANFPGKYDGKLVTAVVRGTKV